MTAAKHHDIFNTPEALNASAWLLDASTMRISGQRRLLAARKRVVNGCARPAMGLGLRSLYTGAAQREPVIHIVAGLWSAREAFFQNHDQLDPLALQILALDGVIDVYYQVSRGVRTKDDAEAELKTWLERDKDQFNTRWAPSPYDADRHKLTVPNLGGDSALQIQRAAIRAGNILAPYYWRDIPRA